MNSTIDEQFFEMVDSNFTECEKEWFDCYIEAHRDFDPERCDALMEELLRLEDHEDQ